MKHLLEELVTISQLKVKFLIESSVKLDRLGFNKLKKECLKDIVRYIKIKKYLQTRLSKY
jgi:hypothetical protein